MNTAELQNAPPIIASAHDDWFDGMPEALQRAVDEYNLPETDDWSPLDELSSATKFDGVEAFADSAVFESGRFVAPASVHVKLVYDPNSSDLVEFADSFPARVYFRISPRGKGKRRTVSVEQIEVDTTSFFE